MGLALRTAIVVGVSFLTACSDDNGRLLNSDLSNTLVQSSRYSNAPKVSLINPVNHSTSVAVNTSITIKYNIPVESSSVNIRTFNVSASYGGPKILGTVTSKGDNLTFTFTPLQPLSNMVTYKIHLNGVVSLDEGKSGATEDFSSTFTTVTGAIAETNLINNSDITMVNPAAADRVDTSVNTVLSIRFPGNINRSSISNNTIKLYKGPKGKNQVQIPILLSWLSGNTLQIIPQLPLDESRTFNIEANGIKNIDGYDLSLSDTFTTS